MKRKAAAEVVEYESSNEGVKKVMHEQIFGSKEGHGVPEGMVPEAGPGVIEGISGVQLFNNT